MNKYELGARLHRWITQVSAAAFIGLGLLSTSEAIGAHNAQEAIVHQQEKNNNHDSAVARLQTEGMKLVAFTPDGLIRMKDGAFTITDDYRPIEPLQAAADRHENRSRDLSIMGGVALFILSGSATAQIALGSLSPKSKKDSGLQVFNQLPGVEADYCSENPDQTESPTVTAAAYLGTVSYAASFDEWHPAGAPATAELIAA